MLVTESEGVALEIVRTEFGIPAPSAKDAEGLKNDTTNIHGWLVFRGLSVFFAGLIVSHCI